MDENIAKRWVKALRSGRYKQGQIYLRVGDKHCCLGVLCRILRVKHHVEPDGMYFYDGESVRLAKSVIAKAGMHSASGTIFFETLAALNDGGSSFTEIADLIEAYWKDL